MLNKIYDEICDFCFVPINHQNLSESIDKSFQYAFCEKLGIPYPQTRSLKDILDSGDFGPLKFPLVIKPTKHIKGEDFRVLYLDSETDYDKNENYLKQLVREGKKFIVSEFIKGDDTNLYFYVAYRSKSGEILNEWTCKKLNQIHGLFGVFSSVSNECPDVIAESGRRLFEEMNLMGICNIEFKYDHIEDNYKLIEINLRSPMLQRIGNRSGVHLQYSQYLDAMGLNVPRQNQDKSKVIHFVYMQHELINLCRRKGYWKHFKHNIFGADERHLAVFDIRDPIPFFYELFLLGKKMLASL